MSLFSTFKQSLKTHLKSKTHFVRSYKKISSTCSESNSEPCQTSTTMELFSFAKIFNSFMLLTIFSKGIHLRCMTRSWIRHCKQCVLAVNSCYTIVVCPLKSQMTKLILQQVLIWDKIFKSGLEESL